MGYIIKRVVSSMPGTALCVFQDRLMLWGIA
nr:MAG TPA: hypothetical protein [Caudoviricetes sp.]